MISQSLINICYIVSAISVHLRPQDARFGRDRSQGESSILRGNVAGGGGDPGGSPDSRIQLHLDCHRPDSRRPHRRSRRQERKNDFGARDGRTLQWIRRPWESSLWGGPSTRKSSAAPWAGTSI